MDSTGLLYVLGGKGLDSVFQHGIDIMLVLQDRLVGEDELVLGVVDIDGNRAFGEIDVGTLVFAVDLLRIFNAVVGAFENSVICREESILDITDGTLGCGFSQNRHGISFQMFRAGGELKTTG